MSNILVACPFGVNLLLSLASFIVLCIIWANLADIKDEFDDILDTYGGDNIKIYTKSSDHFWGPVTIICDENAWTNTRRLVIDNPRYLLQSLNYSNVTNTDSDTIIGNDSDATYSSCDEYIDSNYESLDSSQEYWSLYFLTPNDDKRDEKIKDFEELREFVYVYCIIVVIIVVLLSCCISVAGFAMAAKSDSGEASASIIAMAFPSFIFGFYTSTYGLILCNCLSIIPLTNDTQGDIILLDYIPGWGLLIAFIVTTLVNCCKSIFSDAKGRSNGNDFLKCICQIVNLACFICFGLPIIGYTFYLYNWADKYPNLIDDYMNNVNNDIRISNDYVDTTEYLSDLGIILFIIGWIQCGFSLLSCFIGCFALFCGGDTKFSKVSTRAW